MSDNTRSNPSRRDFIKNTSRVAAASILTGGLSPRLYAGESNTIRVALVGCGGRGTGAAANALSVKNGPIKLVAMADVFPERLAASLDSLKKNHRTQVEVPQDHQFIGFEGYRKAMDCLKPGDVVILGTPPAFRWVHFTYAIQKNLNVFMEKPITVDGPTTRKLLELARQSVQKNLKVGVGLMIRHCRGRQELKQRIDNGEIGEIIAMRAYRMGGWQGCGPKPDTISEVMYQVRKFHSFLWASGGVFSDFYIHQIDECSWMKGAWPVEAHALGGRHIQGAAVDQNLDTYSVEYTFPDGTKLFYYGRNMQGCQSGFSSYAHGTKGLGVISTSGHYPGKVRTYRGHKLDSDNLIWRFPPREPNPYQMEWDDLIAAIREDKPYNEAERGAIASLVTSMGRMAAHTGQTVTYDQILNCPHEFAPHVDKLTENGPAPLTSDAQGRYPVPQPGVITDREY
jgi:predicted dehydrogenase